MADRIYHALEEHFEAAFRDQLTTLRDENELLQTEKDSLESMTSFWKKWALAATLIALALCIILYVFVQR